MDLTTISVIKKLLLLFTLLLLLGACTNSRWIVLEEPEVDYQDRESLESRPIILLDQAPSPENPVMIFKSAELNRVNYAEKLVSERHIQDYRPRYLFMLLGLGASATAIYLANTNNSLTYDFNTEERRLLTIAGGITAVASGFSLRPHGDPRPTGEKVFLNQTGVFEGADTTSVDSNSDVLVSLIYQNSVLASNEELTFSNGELKVDLRNDFQTFSIIDDQPDDLSLEIRYEGITHEFPISIQEVLEPYIVVRRDNASLRSLPSESGGRNLVNLELDSYLPLEEIYDDGWYKTQYNLNTAYISTSEADIEWQIRVDYGTSAVTSGESSYGDVDIESDIKVYPKNPNRIGVIINIGTYSGQIQQIPNFERSGRLVHEYMVNTLGISQDNIIQFRNMNFEQWQDLSARTDSNSLGSLNIKADTTEVFVYFLGHGISSDDNQLYILPSDYSDSEYRISLNEYLETFGQLKAADLIMFFETDFTQQSVTDTGESARRYRSAALREISQSFLENRDNAALFYAANQNQQAGLFTSSDGRINNVHGFFTYYLFQALQNENKTAGDVFRYIQRNVTFTSRRYYDRPQDPQFYGNNSLIFLRDQPVQE